MMNSNKNKDLKIINFIIWTVAFLLLALCVFYILRTYSSGTKKPVSYNTSGKYENHDYNESDNKEENDIQLPENNQQEKIYSIENNGDILDTRNSCHWHICPDQQYNFYEAMDYLEAYNVDHHTKWRLPTYEEIRSLYNKNERAGTGYYRDRKFFPAKINPVFNAIGSGSWFWVSDESKNNDQAYAINLHEGIQVDFNKLDPDYPVHLLLIKND